MLRRQFEQVSEPPPLSKTSSSLPARRRQDRIPSKALSTISTEGQHKGGERARREGSQRGRREEQVVIAYED